MSKVTNQKASEGVGVCRFKFDENISSRKYNLKDFEFSQNYFMFCDKLEKSNYFMKIF